jgi:hypothetical protein
VACRCTPDWQSGSGVARRCMPDCVSGFRVPTRCTPDWESDFKLRRTFRGRLKVWLQPAGQVRGGTPSLASSWRAPLYVNSESALKLVGSLESDSESGRNVPTRSKPYSESGFGVPSTFWRTRSLEKGAEQVGL